MSRFVCTVISLYLYVMPTMALAQEPSRGEQAKLTLGIPAFVAHPKDRAGSRGWNEGWFNNEGIFLDVTWPLWKLGQRTRLRGGFTGGVFDNSIFRTSVFGGGAAEIETDVTRKLTLSVGTYAGAITGYENEVGPAVAPYVGMSHVVTDDLEIGMRGFWLPAETIGGSQLATSDAYIAAMTVGVTF